MLYITFSPVQDTIQTLSKSLLLFSEVVLAGDLETLGLNAASSQIPTEVIKTILSSKAAGHWSNFEPSSVRRRNCWSGRGCIYYVQSGTAEEMQSPTSAFPIIGDYRLHGLQMLSLCPMRCPDYLHLQESGRLPSSI